MEDQVTFETSKDNDQPGGATADNLQFLRSELKKPTTSC